MPADDRARWRVALLLFVLTLVSRLPFLTEHLWAHDSVLYERAIERFDPVDQRPQPPGYLWYVLLIRAVAFVAGDANRAMTLVSAIAAASAVALLYLLASRLYDEETGIGSAVLLATAVTFWGESGVAYPYTLLAALTTLCALLFLRAPLPLASAIWGIAVGFRTDLALFLAPLWLFTARGRPPAEIARALAAGAIPSAAWLAATIGFSGGIARYASGAGAQIGFVEQRYGLAVAQNAYDLARFLGRGLWLITIGLAGLALPKAREKLSRDRRRGAFVLIWALSPLPVYVLVHIGEYGYVFSMLPGLCVLAARGAAAIARTLRLPLAGRALVGTIAAADAVIFLWSPAPLSARDLARVDNGVAERLDALRELDPGCTVLLSAYDRLVVARYAGDRYAVVGFDPLETPEIVRPTGALVPRCRSTVSVALWDDLLRPGDGDWASATMPHGALLRVAHTTTQGTVLVRGGLTVDVR